MAIFGLWGKINKTTGVFVKPCLECCLIVDY